MGAKLFLPDELVATYDYLRSVLPFRKWHLPDSDDLTFAVTAHTDRFGHFDDHDRKKPFPTIAISSFHTKTYRDMREVMAHELCHLHLFTQKYRYWDRHGPRFAELAALACRYHDWNLKHFIG